MKKLLTLTAVGALLTTPSIAVQKCVALNTSDTLCKVTNVYGQADWTSACNSNAAGGISVPVKGIAMCSNQTGSAQYVTSSTLKVSNSSSDTTNKYCWCKAIEPAISHWVYTTEQQDASMCAYQCSHICAYLFGATTNFRNAIIGSMSI
ncbi:MAG: hypothetical protein E7009_03580 [Alphaproteobacteria bacterium]|nr:hypothetical protein [Alphaproteobacteria bacterium]